MVALRSGYLSKLGAGGILYRRRWFVLHDTGLLEYYKTDSCQDLRGSLMLTALSAITLHPASLELTLASAAEVRAACGTIPLLRACNDKHRPLAFAGALGATSLRSASG